MPCSFISQDHGLDVDGGRKQAPPRSHSSSSSPLCSVGGACTSVTFQQDHGSPDADAAQAGQTHPRPPPRVARTPRRPACAPRSRFPPRGGARSRCGLWPCQSYPAFGLYINSHPLTTQKTFYELLGSPLGNSGSSFLLGLFHHTFVKLLPISNINCCFPLKTRFQ